MSNRAPLVLVVAGTLAALSSACSAPWNDSQHGPLTQSQAVSRLEADGFTDVHSVPMIPTLCTPTDMGVTVGHGAHVRRPRYVLTFNDPRPRQSVRTGFLAVYMFPGDDAVFAATCATGGLASALQQSEYIGGKMVPAKRVSPSTIVVASHRMNLPGLIRGTTGDFRTFIAAGPVLGLGDAGNLPGSVRTEADLERALRDLG